MTKIIEKKLRENFQEKDSFSRKDLWHFYKQFEPDLNENTFGWRIFNLKNKNIINAIGNGHYTISDKPKHQPNFSKNASKMGEFIATEFKDVAYCLWETHWLNEFTVHQTQKNWILIEVEKELIETIFYKLKDYFSLDIFLNPDEKIINFYVAESSKPAILKKLTTRSPITFKEENGIKINVPNVEKILVDVFTDQRLFYLFQGKELLNIYENFFKNYSINYSTLFNYANRRGQKENIKKFLTANLGHLIKENMK